VPGSLPDKASAVLRLVERHSIEGVVYFGDDLGDVPVFEAIRARRAESGKPGLAVAVVDSETDSNVIKAADAVVNGTAALEALLVQLAGTIQGR
jgi:trehalose 6-phosphate phosphatase